MCIPNNCAMVTGEEICRDEVRMQVQNVPQEECELQPEENCHMEAVLVPRYAFLQEHIGRAVVNSNTE